MSKDLLFNLNVCTLDEIVVVMKGTTETSLDVRTHWTYERGLHNNIERRRTVVVCARRGPRSLVVMLVWSMHAHRVEQKLDIN